MQRNNPYTLMGAIAGDVIGSVFEFNNNKSLDFPLFSKHTEFTDDTVLTIATAKVLLDGGSYTKAYQNFSKNHPGKRHGGGLHGNRVLNLAGISGQARTNLHLCCLFGY